MDGLVLVLEHCLEDLCQNPDDQNHPDDRANDYPNAKAHDEFPLLCNPCRLRRRALQPSQLPVWSKTTQKCCQETGR